MKIQTIINPNTLVEKDLINVNVVVKDTATNKFLKSKFKNLTPSVKRFLTAKLRKHFLSCDISMDKKVQITTLYVLLEDFKFIGFNNLGFKRI